MTSIRMTMTAKEVRTAVVDVLDGAERDRPLEARLFDWLEADPLIVMGGVSSREQALLPSMRKAPAVWVVSTAANKPPAEDGDRRQ